MTPHAYTENQLVEQPAIGLFAVLGWQTLSAMEETFGGAPSPPAPLPEGEGRIYLGRDTKGEVVLIARLIHKPPRLRRDWSTDWTKK